MRLLIRQFLPINPTLVAGSIELATIAHRSGNFAAAAGILAEALADLWTHPPTITGEYVQLVNLYAKYLGDVGENPESRDFRIEARQMEQQVSPTSLVRSAVNVGELDASGFR